MIKVLTTFEAATALRDYSPADWPGDSALALVRHYEALEEQLEEDLVFCPVELTNGWACYPDLAAAEADNPGRTFAIEDAVPFDGGVLVERGAA